MSPSVVSEHADRAKEHIEMAKFMADAFKHLTTLSTGSILLLATFLEKFFIQPRWKPLIAVTFVGFILSIIASFLVILGLGFTVKRSSKDDEIVRNVGAVLVTGGIISAFASFVLAMIALVAFAMRNFF